MGLIIQVCSLFIALIGVYAFFRLEKIKELIIGQGKAILYSQDPKNDEEKVKKGSTA